MNVPNAIALFTLKWLILCYVNFSSINMCVCMCVCVCVCVLLILTPEFFYAPLNSMPEARALLTNPSLGPVSFHFLVEINSEKLK